MKNRNLLKRCRRPHADLLSLPVKHISILISILILYEYQFGNAKGDFPGAWSPEKIDCIYA